MQRLKTYLSQPVDAAGLGLFRILFGLVLFAQTLYFILTGFVEENLVKPIIHFQYHFFSFLEPLPESGMNLLMILMLLSTVLIISGRFFRIGLGVFLMTFTYLWLLDKGYFNNHYYLTSLLCGLMLFTNADRWGTFFSSKNIKNTPTTVPQWQVFILKAQLVLVFFIAGINKINPYWLLDFQPMTYILEAKAKVSGIDFLTTTAVAAFFSYGGLLHDLLIGFGMWWRKTRRISIIAFVGFNIMNFWIFYNIGEIGFFPFLLIASIALFVAPKSIRQAFRRFEKQTKSKTKKAAKNNDKSSYKPITTYLILGYFTLQLLIPFRHLLYPGPVDWSGEGQRFAWRMKIVLKEADVRFFLEDQAGTQYKVDVAGMLSPKQYTNLVYYPDLIPTLARRLRSEGIKKGIPDPKVTAELNVRFMGRGEKEPIVDPKTDLSKVSYRPFKSNEWILNWKEK